MILMELKTILWYKVQGGNHEKMERKCIVVDETVVGKSIQYRMTLSRSEEW